MENVHRAGSVLAILGELDRTGLMNRDVNNILGMKLPETLDKYDIMLTQDEAVKKMYRGAVLAGIRRTTQAFSQDCRWDTLDDDRTQALENAFSL